MSLQKTSLLKLSELKQHQCPDTPSYAYIVYKYDLFNGGNYSISIAAYALIYAGFIVYNKAIANNGDILNGQLLIGIGVLLIISIIIYNIKKTSFFIGLILSLIQAVLYSVLATIGILFVIAAIAFFSETKPVYVVNN